MNYSTMTTEDLITRLNLIQADALCGCLTDEMRGEWNLIHLRLRMKGVNVGHKQISGQVIWYVKQNHKPMNRVSAWVEFAPKCDHKNQCTTRALFFCLEEKIPYESIRDEQNHKALAKYGVGRCHGWNNRSVWETVLTERGFVKIALPRRIRAYRLAEILAPSDSRILCHANRHCLSVYNAKVYDSWDSSMKFCDYILCRREIETQVRMLLRA